MAIKEPSCPGLSDPVFCCWDKVPKELKSRKGLFWVMVSEVSVQGLLVLLLSDYGKAACHGE
jgi:hypothetical protein